MIQDAAFQELRTKHNLGESECEELSRLLEEMRNLPTSMSKGKMRKEHQRLRRVLRFLTRGNETLEQDVLHLLWQISTATKERRTQERGEARNRHSKAKDVIVI
jgi:hypothetical protein